MYDPSDYRPHPSSVKNLLCESIFASFPPGEALGAPAPEAIDFCIDKLNSIPYTETIKGVADTGFPVSAWSSVRFSEGGPAMRRSGETLLYLMQQGVAFLFWHL